MGLYGERTGALHFTCSNSDTAAKVLSQVKIIIRANYSSPPIHGERIVAKVINDESYRTQWLAELQAVTDRMNNMRKLLKGSLLKNQCKGNWDHITN